ncbi:ATP-dependent helicase C-terminal domain-containing protein, partial [Streptomyces virginiae]|uniref:ATP-dependent helicase C-terminal domain-containing protein n=1 Tax=Streptomyces virginiae TaxID=1961 RepID=UPI0033ABD44B
RLARALLDGSAALGARRAAEVVALLSEEPPREYGDDLAAAWRRARAGGDAYAARWRTEAHRLERALQDPAGLSAAPPLPDTGGSASGSPVPGSAPRPAAAPPPGAGRVPDDAAAGLIAALAFPERIARSKGSGAFLMASGTGADLGDGSALRHAPWLAVAVADRPPHSAAARIRLAAVVDEDTALTAAAHLRADADEVHWEGGDVVARAVQRLGAIELAVRPLRAPGPALVRAALLDGLRAEGLALLRWTPDARALRARLGFLHRTLGGAWPDVADDAVLLERADDWLEPELSRARRRADLARIDAGQALNRLLPWATGEAVRLDELAPERLEVPSGSRIRLDYSAEHGQPVLAVKLQELFGLAETPRVAGVPVLVHLLSPAGRPAAVTADLASFWQGGYRAVRAELRGRYPKHPWPEDPAAAEPTRHTNARLRR